MRQQNVGGRSFEVRKSPYVLVPKAAIGCVSSLMPRRGCLLKFDFAEDAYGYSDCFPWPELGDLPLDTQMQYLRQGRWTPLTARSFYFAQVDAQARRQGLSLWQNARIPPSHALISNVSTMEASALVALHRQGFTHVKVKVGLKKKEEIQRLVGFRSLWRELGFKIRLDFNQGGFIHEDKGVHKVEEIMHQLDPIFDSIEYLEDLCAYDPGQWQWIQKRWGVRLALDAMPACARALLSDDSVEGPVKGSCSFLILKPAIQDPEKIMNLAIKIEVPVVVTSYLDHPLGQLGAAWVASHLAKQYPQQIQMCGLLSHFAYEESAFSLLLQSQGPNMLPPAGFGFGMDQHLLKLQWLDL